MDDSSPPPRPEGAPDSTPSPNPLRRGSGVPAVVAVVVTKDRGDRLRETLDSLATQEYGNLSVLVVDAGSADDPTALVADALPNAFVRRLDAVTWAEAANEALDSVENASFLLFLHDDVVLGTGAVQALVEEGFRANAGIVGPKLVEWDDPERLASVGLSVDRFGFTWEIAEPGELDQSQHDATREVFSVSGAAILIRADLFADIGGFSTDIDGACEDLDLCWRAKVAGGRTVIMPAARVRHGADSSFGDRADPHRSLTLRHQIRVALVCYSIPSLARVIPQSLALIPGDMVLTIAGGRGREVGSILGALAWNVAHLPKTVRLRSAVSASRHISDSDIKRLQLTGSARISALTRGTADGGSALAGVGDSLRSLPVSISRRTPTWVVAVWAALVALIALGSRSLITGRVPAIREFLPFGDAGMMMSEWWSGWRTTGMGASTPAPSILGIVGTAQSLTWADGLVRTLVLLGPVPLGAVALWRMLGKRVSAPARCAALAAFSLNPLPYNAISEGRWQALVVYGATPALLGALLAVGGWDPFAPESGVEPIVRAVGRLAFVIAVAAAVAPAAGLVAVILALLVSVVVWATPDGGDGSLRRMFIGLAVGLVAAGAIHLPWVWAVMSSSNRWSTLVGANASGSAPADLAAALRFETGPAGGVLGLGLWIAPVVAVATARASRFRWSVLSVSISVASLFLVVCAGRLSPGVAMPATEVLLAPAVTGIALGVAMWVEAFVNDVSGGSFSWRQIGSGIAVLGLVVGSLPIIGQIADGRWGAPAGDIESAMADASEKLDPQRTLRIGDPDALGGRGWSLDEHLDFTVTDGPTSTLSTLFPHGRLDGERALRTALSIASAGETTRLGSLLAPFGIDYVVVIDRLAPLPYGIETIEARGPLPGSLAQQVDLARVEVQPGLVAYRNEAALPRRGSVEQSVGAAITDLSVQDVIAAGVIDSRPVLDERTGLVEFRGDVASGRSVIVSDNADPAWSLTVEGTDASATPAFGWATQYEVDSGGAAVLARRASGAAVLGHLIQLLALIAVIAMMVAHPMRRRRPRGAE